MRKIRIYLILVLLLVSGGAIGAYYLLYKDVPTFTTIRKIRVTQFTKANLRVNCDVICYNPNNVGGRVAGGKFDVFANGKLVSEIEQGKGVIVGANSSFTVPLTANFSPMKIFKPLDLLGAAFLTLKRQRVEMRYVGSLTLSLGGNDIIDIPVEFEEAIPLKSK